MYICIYVYKYEGIDCFGVIIMPNILYCLCIITYLMKCEY